jgi:uncharacterized membrane protein YhaH (DUF805 family)
MDMSLFTSFDGRIGRQNWWLGIIALFVVEWIIMFVLSLLFGFSMMGGMDPNNPEVMGQAMGIMSIPFFIILLLFLWPALAIYAKRWHDRGKSGWWSLIGLVPIVGFFWILIELGMLKGSDGPNQYGPDPVAD